MKSNEAPITEGLSNLLMTTFCVNIKAQLIEDHKRKKLEFAEEVYQRFEKKHRAILSKMPLHWLIEERVFVVSVLRDYLEVDVIELELESPVRMPVLLSKKGNRYQHDEGILQLTKSEMERFATLESDYKQSLDRIHRTRDHILQLLHMVETVSELFKVWPECRPICEDNGFTELISGKGPGDSFSTRLSE